MNELKEETRAYPRKRLRDGNGSTETASHDGDDVEGYCDSDTKGDPPD